LSDKSVQLVVRLSLASLA